MVGLDTARDLLVKVGVGTKVPCSRFRVIVDELKAAGDLAIDTRYKEEAVVVPGECISCGDLCVSECMCGALFCSKECQRLIWKRHMPDCERAWNTHMLPLVATYIELTKCRKIDLQRTFGESAWLRVGDAPPNHHMHLFSIHLDAGANPEATHEIAPLLPFLSDGDLQSFLDGTMTEVHAKAMLIGSSCSLPQAPALMPHGSNAWKHYMKLRLKEQYPFRPPKPGADVLKTRVTSPRAFQALLSWLDVLAFEDGSPKALPAEDVLECAQEALFKAPHVLWIPRRSPEATAMVSVQRTVQAALSRVESGGASTASALVFLGYV